MHDPFQAYALLGSHYGIPSPLGLPHPALQGTMNPALQGTMNPISLNPYAAILGLSPMAGITQGVQPAFGQYPGHGQIGPQQMQQLQQLLQLTLALASQGAIQNPLLAQLINPLISAGLNPSALGPNVGQLFGQPYSPYPQIGQIGSPYGQIGYPLAPQNWIGQGGQFGGGQGFGAAHPFLSPWSARPFQSQGSAPWGS